MLTTSFRRIVVLLAATLALLATAPAAAQQGWDEPLSDIFQQSFWRPAADGALALPDLPVPATLAAGACAIRYDAAGNQGLRLVTPDRDLFGWLRFVDGSGTPTLLTLETLHAEAGPVYRTTWSGPGGNGELSISWTEAPGFVEGTHHNPPPPASDEARLGEILTFFLDIWWRCS